MNHFEIKREKSRELILKTALLLFAENGYEKTSIRTIAKEAGISLGLMYNYFENKDALLTEIFRKSHSESNAAEKELTDVKQPANKRLENYLRQTVQTVKKQQQFLKLLHGIRLQSEVVKKLMQERKTETEQLEQQVSNCLLELQIPFPNLEARLLLASLDGIANQFLLQQNYPIDDVAELLIRKYIR